MRTLITALVGALLALSIPHTSSAKEVYFLHSLAPGGADLVIRSPNSTLTDKEFANEAKRIIKLADGCRKFARANNVPEEGDKYFVQACVEAAMNVNVKELAKDEQLMVANGLQLERPEAKDRARFKDVRDFCVEQTLGPGTSGGPYDALSYEGKGSVLDCMRTYIFMRQESAYERSLGNGANIPPVQ
ncbi:MAG TPA: hypothetical protein VF829_03730 [Candidatus Paceibacterota bacterium]